MRPGRPSKRTLLRAMCLFPEPSGDRERVDAGLTPPRALVAGAMHRPMMPATEWDRELIADLAAERTGLVNPRWWGSEGFRRGLLY